MKKTVYFTLGTHLDLFWMGTPKGCLDYGAEIIDKVLDLCKEHNDYCFYVESTIFMDYYLRKRPERKELIKQLVDLGRIEIGASYVDRVEHSHEGESILRHHILGIYWLRDELGITPKSVCHPDLPGLSPQVPQILSKVGIEYYLRARGVGTMFNWKAPDGSSVIYINIWPASPASYGKKKIEDIDKLLSVLGDSFEWVLVRGGYGDLEMPDDDIYRLMEESSEKYPEVEFKVVSPTVVLSSLRKVNPEELPVIKGEWPFGWGGATSSFPIIHRLDSKLENKLLTCEKLFAICRSFGINIESPTKSAIWWKKLGHWRDEVTPPEIKPGEELIEAWKAELFPQDHNYSGFCGVQNDFIKKEFKLKALDYVETLVDSALSNIASFADTNKNNQTPIVVFNPSSWERNEIVSIDIKKQDEVRVIDSEKKPVTFYKEKEGSITFEAKNIPPLGYKTFYVKEGRDNNFVNSSWINTSLSNNIYSIDTDNFQVKINSKDNTVEKLYSKSIDKDISVQNSFAKLISVYDPGPDVRYNLTDKVTNEEPIKAYIKEITPLRAVICLQGEIFSSKVEKELVFYKNKDYIDLAVRLYWWGKREEHLRLLLPFNSDGYKETWYGVPFYSMKWPEMMEGVDSQAILNMGNVNPDELEPKDRYHFRQVIKWIEVSYGDVGAITALNQPMTVYIDSNKIEPVLLTTQYSCGDRDVWQENPGEHVWEFRIIPHRGGWKEAKAYRVGWEFSTPVLSFVPRIGGTREISAKLPQNYSFCQITPDNIILTAMKPAYRDPKAIILRLVDYSGEDADVEIVLWKDVAKAYQTNLLEEEETELEVKGNVILCRMKSYEIKTIKVFLEERSSALFR